MGNNATRYIFIILIYINHRFAKPDVMSMFKHEYVIPALTLTKYTQYCLLPLSYIHEIWKESHIDGLMQTIRTFTANARAFMSHLHQAIDMYSSQEIKK